MYKTPIKRLVALLLNFTIFYLVILAVATMAKSNNDILSEASIKALKYFTVQSNLLAGLVSLISCVFYLLPNERKPSRVFSVIKLVSTTAVTLTLLTVIFYILPLVGFVRSFSGGNFYMHLVVPILCIIDFVFMEKDKEFRYRDNVFSIIPPILYGIFYFTNLIINNGFGNIEFDWYGFGMFGLGIGMIVFAVMVGFTFGISNALYFSFKRANKKKDT